MRLYVWDCEWDEPEFPQDCYREITPNLGKAADVLNEMLGFKSWATVTATGIEAIISAAFPDEHEIIESEPLE